MTAPDFDDPHFAMLSEQHLDHTSSYTQQQRSSDQPSKINQ